MNQCAASSPSSLACSLVVLVGVAVFSFVTVRRSFPDTTGTVHVSALKADVSVQRDGKGIPQIYADTPEDLFLAQGYVHAQDRFYEMDFRRHVTAGRLAELVGDAALDTDKFVRTLGWRRVARAGAGPARRRDAAPRQRLCPRGQRLHRQPVGPEAVAGVRGARG